MKTAALWSALLTAAAALAAEVPVTQPVFGPARGNQSRPAVASDGDQYLVVWTDERTDVEQAYAARLSGDGVLLDPHGIRLATRTLTYYPSVIWSGSSWFVIANDCSSISFVRLDRNGTPLDAAPRALPVNGWCPGVSLATDGRRVAVGYVSGYPRKEVHALILDQDGALLGDVQLSAGASEPPIPPAVAWDGSSFVAVWQGHAARFDAGGVRGAVRDVLFLGFAADPFVIASDGHDFVVVRSGLSHHMTADLAAEYQQPLPFHAVQSISWNGSEYVVFGGDPSPNPKTLNMLRLDRDGRAVSNQTFHSADTASRSDSGLAAATNGRTVLVAWQDPTETPENAQYPDSDTYASILSLPSLAPQPRMLLSVGAPWQGIPVIAAGRDNELVVWTEASGLMARRYRRDGTSDDTPLRLSANASSAAVAFNGSDYIVGTTEGNAVVVRRVPAAGALRVERESRADQHLPNFVALAGDGSAMLIAWFADGGIYAARVAADGAVLDATPLRVAPAALARNARRIVIAPGADGAFLIVWGGTIPGCLCSPTIPPEAGPVRAARVTATLSLLDAVPIQVANVGGGTLNADAPAAAWNGQEWLVVWNRAFGDLMGPQPVIGQEIRGRRIARNGTLLDSTADQPGILIVRDGFAPAIAWNGAAYVFAWREGAPHYDGLFSSQRIQPMHVASLDLAGVTSAVTLGESADEEPISISVTDGFAFLGYARIGDSARYGGVSRAFLTVPDSDRRRRRAAQPLR